MVIAIGILLWGLFLALQLPIYPDEIAYRIFLERLFINGGLKQSVTPYCTEGFMVAPPLTLLPASVTWASLSLFDGGYWSYRFVACICWLVIFATFYAYGRRNNDQSFWPILLMILVGPTIYSLILLRPEIIILTTAVLIYFWGSKTNSHSSFSIIFGGLLLTFVYSLALYMHPKLVYLAPALVCAVILRARGLTSKVARLCFIGISCALCGGLVFNAIGMHKLQLLSCAAYPSLQETMTNQAVNLLQSFSDPKMFFSKLDQAFSPNLWKITLERLSYWHEYETGYLPGTKYDSQILLAFRYSFVVILMMLLLMTLINLLKIFFSWKRSPIFWDAGLLTLVSIGLILPIALNLRHHFYDVSFLTSSIIIVSCLAWPLRRRAFSEAQKYSANLAYPLISLGFIFLGLFGLTILNDFSEKFNRGYEGPSIGINKINSQKDIGSYMEKLLADNGISRQDPIIVDDLTYDFVMSHAHVHPITYLFVNPDIARDISIIIKANNINYGLTRCGYIQALMPTSSFSILKIVKTSSLDNICLFSI